MTSFHPGLYLALNPVTCFIITPDNLVASNINLGFIYLSFDIFHSTFITFTLTDSIKLVSLNANA